VVGCYNGLKKCDELDLLSRKTAFLTVNTNPVVIEVLRKKAVDVMKRRGITTDTNIVLFTVFLDRENFLLQYRRKSKEQLGGCGIFSFDSLLNITGFCFGL
jgi:hypothetical protein